MGEGVSKATWIWYPDDYEIWLHASVSVKRQFRGYVCPPFWRLDSAYSNVMFRKSFDLKQPERLTLSVQGTFVIHLDGSMIPMPYEQKPITSIIVPSGKHELTIKVYNDRAVPSLYAAGATSGTDSSWEVTCHNGKWVKAASGNFDDIASPPASFPFSYETVNPVSIMEKDGVTVLDFGRETFGFVKFTDMKGKGKIRLYYGESFEEAMAGIMAETRDELDVDCETPRLFATPVTRAFRYIQLQADTGISWSEVQHDYEYLPLDRRGSFRCSDERLNRIWDVSVHTLHLTTREFMFDGIKRDLWVWSGDAYQSFLMNNYVFFDQEVTKRTLIALRGKDPVELHINTIMDYTFYWFISFYDYFMYTGDRAFIESSYPKMLTLMDFCLQRRNGDGMMEGYPEDWVFIDWADMEKSGEVCFEQLMFCRSLETLALIAKEMGDFRNEQKFTDLGLELHDRIFEVFWDETKGAFIHGRLEDQLNERILKYPSMFGLRFGYLDERQIDLVKRSVMLNDSVQKINTPFMRFFELEALCEIGEQGHVLEEIRDYWGGMLDLGATTFWEEYDPSVPMELQYDMYGEKFRKSLCHAWGAAPTYLFGKYFIGVRPEEPGFSEYTIEPYLGDLTWMEGSVPTPNGEITVYADQEYIRVKTNLSGSGKLRFKSGIQPEANDGVIREVGLEVYELELNKPDFNYEVKVRLQGMRDSDGRRG